LWHASDSKRLGADILVGRQRLCYRSGVVLRRLGRDIKSRVARARNAPLSRAQMNELNEPGDGEATTARRRDGAEATAMGRGNASAPIRTSWRRANEQRGDVSRRLMGSSAASLH